MEQRKGIEGFYYLDILILLPRNNNIRLQTNIIGGLFLWKFWGRKGQVG